MKCQLVILSHIRGLNRDFLGLPNQRILPNGIGQNDFHVIFSHFSHNFFLKTIMHLNFAEYDDLTSEL